MYFQFDKVIKTVLTDSRSARSQLTELIEKLEIAIAIYDVRYNEFLVLYIELVRKLYIFIVLENLLIGFMPIFLIFLMGINLGMSKTSYDFCN